MACIVVQTLGFGAGLGGVTVAARMMFAFGRDGLAWRRLSGVSAGTGVPRRALAAEMLIGLVLLTAFRLAGTSALNVFFYLATTGTLALLVMYVLTNVAAAWHLGRRSPVQLLLPAAGVLIAGFVLYHNVWPVPPEPYRFLPYLVLGWLLAGLVPHPGGSEFLGEGGRRARASRGGLGPRRDRAHGPGSPPPLSIRHRACGRSPAGGS